jgi:hypothetical protein
MGLLDLARRERLTPLFHRLFDAGELPSEMLHAIERDYHESAGRFLLLSAGLKEVLEVFRQENIEAIVLKGMAIAEPVYGDPASRPMDDIDLLVHREDVLRALTALADLGYEGSPSFRDDLRSRAASIVLPSKAPSTRPVVDLHWSLVDEKYGQAASRWAEGVWTRAHKGSISGIGARVLSPTDCLIHSCVHLSVNHGLLGLLWYCDLAMMARVWQKEIEWDRLVDWVVEARLTGAVYAALRCAEAMVGLRVPARVFSRLRPRSLRARATIRWLVPRLVALRSIPYQDYVVPLLLMDRGWDVLALVLRRFLLPGSGPLTGKNFR